MADDKEIIQIRFAERYRLGTRAFFMFFLRRVKWPLILLGVLLIFWYFQDAIPPAYAVWNGAILDLGGILCALLFVGIAIRTYLEYIGYTFKFEQEYFQITQGYIIKNETTIPYHQIQHVNLRATFLGQMLGICHLTVRMVGSDHMKDEMLLPAVSRSKARVIQRELMHQARRHFYNPQADLGPEPHRPDVSDSVLPF